MCNLNECVMWLELVDCQYEHFLYQPGGLLSCKPPSAVLADLPALCVRCKWFTFFLMVFSLFIPLFLNLDKCFHISKCNLCTENKYCYTQI